MHVYTILEKETQLKGLRLRISTKMQQIKEDSWLGSPLRLLQRMRIQTGILSDSHMEVEGVKPAALNGNNRNQGSYEEILGKDLLAREKFLFNPKIKSKVFKKRPKKNK
ncbi:hypothetical protein Golax_023244, partial [Gossypium laxum]|nr:hypothetical protein [Gossypium laxum]